MEKKFTYGISQRCKSTGTFQVVQRTQHSVWAALILVCIKTQISTNLEFLVTQDKSSFFSCQAVKSGGIITHIMAANLEVLLAIQVSTPAIKGARVITTATAELIIIVAQYLLKRAIWKLTLWY